MHTTRSALLLSVVYAIALAGAAACGGGNSSKDNEGAAASASASFFVQEAQGAKLPQGVNVTSVGAQKIVPLSVSSDQKKQSVSLRYCVEYSYRERVSPFPSHSRVYIASLLKGGKWGVEPVKDDGTCEGVS